MIAAVDRYIAEGRSAGLDDAALLEILRAKLSQSRQIRRASEFSVDWNREHPYAL